jgi:RNA polymerase sigma-70 factor (ECF subfamily)
MAANDANAIFHELRPRLQAIAYSLLGSVADAEDVVQDVWLRLHAADQSTINNVEAWLVTVTTRASIDRFRSLKARRELYVGLWLPEPVLTEGPVTPEQIQERHGEVSLALLSMLERLSPEGRAALLLREIFDVGYADIAEAIGKKESAIRQIVSRAKSQLRDDHPRYDVSPEAHERIVKRFAQALSTGQTKLLTSILADDAELFGDGCNLPMPMHGGRAIAERFHLSKLHHKDALRFELASINGEISALRFIGDALEAVLVVETDGEHIVRILLQRNPQKLARVAAKLGVSVYLPPA